ncbi:MAG: hypothetical protein CME36_06705 [unclassified Hahellaceae]|nr:hypothetical protein [Hahellaceae bacterium]
MIKTASVDSTRARAASTVNTEFTTLYWQIGQRIQQEILGARRADYAEGIVSALRRQLSWTHLKTLKADRMGI